MRLLTDIRLAVFNRLKGGLNVPVFDSVIPGSAAFPCVRYSFLPVREWPSFLTPSGFASSALVVDVFSKQKTMTEADTILKQVIDLLDRWTMEFQWGKVKLGLLTSNRIYDEDNDVWHATAQFSVHLVA